jgi:hypothetical protein
MSVWSIVYCLARPICPPNSPNNLQSWYMTDMPAQKLPHSRVEMDGDTLSSGAGIFKQSVGARNRVGIVVAVPARQATQPSGIVSLELILGLLTSLKIRALLSCEEESTHEVDPTAVTATATPQEIKTTIQKYLCCSRFHTYSYVQECQQFTFYPVFASFTFGFSVTVCF